jgi:multicomponent K+:H+ antiporter subunit G
MNGAAEIPLPIALAIALSLLSGAFLTLAGAIGLITFRTFYQRVHSPTLGSSMGMFLILVSSILFFSVSRGRPVFHELLIAVFLTLTTPISLMLVVRAALFRDRLAGNPAVPQIADELINLDEDRNIRT